MRSHGLLSLTRRGLPWPTVCTGIFLFLAALEGCGSGQESNEGHYLPPLPALRVESTRIVDDQRRTILLRGVNLSNSNKSPNPSGSFIPDWIDEAVFAAIAQRGYNAVRLVMVWEAIEPQPGVYDQSYLEGIRHIVRLAYDQAIYTILDMHQDIFSRTYGGAGAPEWALPYWPLPYEPLSPWFLNYIRPVVLTAFDRFWQDSGGIQYRFRECWARLAQWFRDEPGVAGYDLMNEPYPGSLLFFPDRFDQEGLGPFTRNLITRLREEDPNHMIFFEPSAVRTNVLAPFGFPSAMPADLGNNLVFAPHFYDPIVTLTHQWNNEISRLEDAADGLVSEAERLSAALWVGEWNVWEYSVQKAPAYLEAQLKVFDERAASWAFWEYNLDSPDCPFTPGSPNTWMAVALERPYPHRAAGIIEDLSFTPVSGQFLLEVHGLSGISAPSEIYLPEYVYGNDFTVNVSDGATWSFDQTRRILAVNAPADGQVQVIEVLP